MNTSQYIEIFDSRNTSITEKVQDNITVRALSNIAKSISTQKGVYKSIAHKNGLFEEYENGKLTSWSYPSGLGNIR